MRCSLTVAPLALVLAATPAAAQSAAMRSAPVAIPLASMVPDAVDAPYPGTIALVIDATDVQRGVYRVTETIPVAPGTERLTLLLPQWLPGTHGPRGTLAEVGDIRFLVDGKPVAWTRDPVEVFAFHLDLPAGTGEVVAKFVHTSPLQASEGRITMTREMLNLQWEKMSLYPAGHYVRRIRVKPTVTFPAGWTAATALDGASGAGGTVTWAETDYETLVDSPIFAGAHFRKWDMGRGVTLNTVADSPEQLAAEPANIAKLRALVDEAVIAF
ncbi:MAG: peptidase M61, partial [Novosphingobium sp.]